VFNSHFDGFFQILLCFVFHVFKNKCLTFQRLDILRGTFGARNRTFCRARFSVKHWLPFFVSICTILPVRSHIQKADHICRQSFLWCWYSNEYISLVFIKISKNDYLCRDFPFRKSRQRYKR